MSTSGTSGHIRSLDGVRGLAILLVLLFHAGLAGYGWMGVQLFFVLSGFLITGILWKERQTATSLGYKFKKFWTRRSLRIFPLYFGYLIAMGVVYLVTHFPSNYRLFAPYLFTYTFNYTRALSIYNGPPLFSQLWSLCVEEQFYIFFPLVIFFCPPRFTRWFMGIVIIAAPLVRYGLTRHYLFEGVSPVTAGDAVYRNTLSHLDAFFMGGLIPVLALDKRVRRPGLWFLVALVVALAAGYLFGPRSAGYLFDLGYPQGSLDHALPVWSYTCVDAVFACFLLLVVSVYQRPVLIRALSAPWLVRVGQVSYGIYVFHLAIWWYLAERLVVHYGGGWLFRLALFVPYVFVVWGLAELSYRLYEVRFIRLKDKLFPGGGAAEIRATVPAAAAEDTVPAVPFTVKPLDV